MFSPPVHSSLSLAINLYILNRYICRSPSLDQSTCTPSFPFTCETGIKGRKMGRRFHAWEQQTTGKELEVMGLVLRPFTREGAAVACG